VWTDPHNVTEFSANRFSPKDMSEEKLMKRTTHRTETRLERFERNAKKYTCLKYFQTSTYYALLIVSVHIAVGVVFFVIVPGESWSFVDALYFTIVTLTTVGYGDREPETQIGKWFTSFYVLFGLIVVFNLLSTIIQGLWDSQEKYILGLLYDDDDDDDDDKKKKDLQEPTTGVLTVSLVALLLIAAIGLIVVMYLESLSFTNAFYFVAISATTVGFGDVHPTKDSTKMFCVFWLILLTLGLGNAISEYQTFKLDVTNFKSRKRVLQKKWNKSDFLKFDPDRDGIITEADFIVRMLLDMELVSRNEIDAISAQFRERDVDHSGAITMSDFKAAASK